MVSTDFTSLFTPEILAELFPTTRTNDFFEALFGDAEEGAYNIALDFARQEENSLVFEFRLMQRPGKCLACNLTYGLPEVFSRHPIINVRGLVDSIEEKLGGRAKCTEWKFGTTREISRDLHVIPLFITLE